MLELQKLLIEYSNKGEFSLLHNLQFFARKLDSLRLGASSIGDASLERRITVQTVNARHFLTLGVTSTGKHHVQQLLN